MNEHITRLEEKIAYLERHVVEQDKAMLEFAEDLAHLKREVKALNGKLAGSGASMTESGTSDERPPHY